MTRFALGIPCTISSLIDAHTLAGNPYSPLNDGNAPSCERMNSSIMRSTSSVDIPARVSVSARRTAAARICPPRAIISISLADLSCIIACFLLPRAPSGCELDALKRLRRPGRNVRHFADRVYALHRNTMGIIPLDYRRGELLVNVEPILNGIRLVVLAANETAAVAAWTRGARLQSPERRPTHVAGRARAEPPDQFSVIRLAQQHRLDRAATARERIGETFRLRYGADCAVENCAARGFGRRNRVAKDPENHRIGNEIAAIHELLGLESERRAFTHSGAKQIAGGDFRNAKASCKQLA